MFAQCLEIIGAIKYLEMFKTLKLQLILFILSGFTILSQAQSFELTTDNFLQLHAGIIKWADLDNDNDLDIIYSGFTDGANEYFTKVYENSNGSFISRVTNLPNIRNGSFVLGDFDGDDDLDILLSGLSSAGNISVLYENNGLFAFSLKQSFPGLINTTVSWFDIDNDEDLDFLLAGVDDNSGGPDPFTTKMIVYENMNGGFNVLSDTNLPPCAQCSMDWADSNGDGKIDLIITGFQDDGIGRTELYLNNGDNTFTKDQSSIFKDLANGDVKWGDYDNDGDMDILLSGVMVDGNISTAVYQNTHGVLREVTNIQIYPVGENYLNGTGWFDYNNDGLLDIVISGRGTSVVVLERIFKLYKNNGDGIFHEVLEPNFNGISGNSVDFGDFDNDGDADISFTAQSGTGAKTGIFRNKLISGSYSANSIPSPPSLASSSERFFRTQIKISWPSGTDAQTPAAGLSYNFYLKHGSSKFVVPTSNFASGNLLTTNPANGHGKAGVVYDVPEGNCSWAVQSIDGAKSGSLFSPEKIFYQINGPEAIKAEIINVTNVKLHWLDNSSIETSYHVTRSTNPISGFSPLANLPPNIESYQDNNAFLTDTYYYYRINAANATKASAHDSLSVLIPSAPENLLAQTVNTSKISLAWEDGSQYEIGFEVQRKLPSELTFQTIALLASNSESYIDNGLNEGTNYEYRVRALISYGGSAYTNISSAQTNFRPLGINFEKQTLEDEVMNFTSMNFINTFSDPDATDQLVKVVIAELPQKGILNLNGVAVATGQIISLEDLNNLQFIPDPNANGTSILKFYNNDGKDNSAVSYSVNIKIVPVNDAPAFSLPTLIEANEDFVGKVTVTPTIAAVPTDELSQVVTYSIEPASSDKVIVNLSPNTGEIYLTSILNEFGDVELALTANDGQPVNNTFSIILKLTIKAVNDAPVLSTISDKEVEYPLAISPIKFMVADVDNPIATVVVSAKSGNQTLIKNSNITVLGNEQERSIEVMPESGSGETVVTVAANDGVATTSTQFSIRIFSVTSVSEQAHGVKVFPNPFASFINVSLVGQVENRYSAKLHDLLGQEVLTQMISIGESTLNSKELSDGIYILSIFEVTGDIIYRRRIIKN